MVIKPAQIKLLSRATLVGAIFSGACGIFWLYTAFKVDQMRFYFNKYAFYTSAFFIFACVIGAASLRLRTSPLASRAFVLLFWFLQVPDISVNEFQYRFFATPGVEVLASFRERYLGVLFNFEWSPTAGGGFGGEAGLVRIGINLVAIIFLSFAVRFTFDRGGNKNTLRKFI